MSESEFDSKPDESSTVDDTMRQADVGDDHDEVLAAPTEDETVVASHDEDELDEEEELDEDELDEDEDELDEDDDEDELDEEDGLGEGELDAVEDELDDALTGDSRELQSLSFPSQALTAEAVAWMNRELHGPMVRRHGDTEILDAVSGRISALGLAAPEVRDALAAAIDDVSSAEANDTDGGATEVLERFQAVFAQTHAAQLCDSIHMAASADLAVEQAVLMARRHRPQNAYRTVALVGSDHGRTFLCRTASGRPELHEDLGPLAAGFAHVPFGDLQALDVVVDEQTASVLVSPNLWTRGGQLLDADYLAAVRRLCDERDVLMIVDETQIVFGSTGTPLAMSAIAEVRPDIAVFSSGLFGGLPGGVTLASSRVSGNVSSSLPPSPLSNAVVSASLDAITERGLFAAAEKTAESFAVELAERVSQFEFVRDIHVLGLSIGIETDLDSNAIVRAAAERRLRLEPAGPFAVRIQPPLVLTDADCVLLTEAIEQTLVSIQLASADVSI